jgi:hypothetical protein
MCGADLHHDPPIYASSVVGMTGIHHHSKLFYWLRWGFINILPCWATTAILPISAFYVARITGLNHHIQAKVTFLNKLGKV